MAFFAWLMRSLSSSPDTFPRIFSHIHSSYLNKTLYAYFLWSAICGVSIFGPILWKKIVPLWTLKNFMPSSATIRSPDFFSHFHSFYLNETWYAYSLWSAICGVSIFGPVLWKKIRPPMDLEKFYALICVDTFPRFVFSWTLILPQLNLVYLFFLPGNMRRFYFWKKISLRLRKFLRKRGYIILKKPSAGKRHAPLLKQHLKVWNIMIISRPSLLASAPKRNHINV